MMKPRKYLLPIILAVALLGPGSAMAAEDPAVTDSVPMTIDEEAIAAALDEQAGQSEDDKSVFEKASDFVTDNAPWFIIGIIVLAAIVAGILIMRGRPRKPKSAAGSRQPAGPGQAEAPSASELRRRKRAAIQRSREEERIRRKAEVENRKAARRGEPPRAPVAASGAAMAATGPGPGAGLPAAELDPVEAEKQGARDQEVAAAAMARFGGSPAGQPVASSYSGQPTTHAYTGRPPAPSGPVPAASGAIPAPVSPSQTAPATGVVTPEQATGPDPAQPQQPQHPEQGFREPESAEADTSVLYEPSIENPGADAAVGDAADQFLGGGAAGAAAGTVGGLSAARAGHSESPPEPDQPLEPLVPEPGMTAEHALAESEPDVPAEPEALGAEVPVEPEAAHEPPQPGFVEPAAEDASAAAADQRLRAKVAEIRATQEPSAPPAPAPDFSPELPEPAPPGPEAELSPGLAAVERKLSQNSEERDRTLRDAEERLRRVEQRAEDAERRAAFAERLAQLKVEESEREKRLNNVVSGIDRAEQRALEAEARAESAERSAAAALEQSDLTPAETASEALAVGEPAPEAAPSTPAPPKRPAPGTADDPAAPAPEPAAPPRKGLFGSSPSPQGGSGSMNLNSATFEELREAGLSVTQATRILAYRERFGGYSAVEDLEKVPGFPEDLIESLKGKISV